MVPEGQRRSGEACILKTVSTKMIFHRTVLWPLEELHLMQLQTRALAVLMRKGLLMTSAASRK
uniref:Uncharacterized protein n=1 Tax=Arundo donax TaxID=35708 RepID=A0A0A9HJ78_ARUDO